VHATQFFVLREIKTVGSVPRGLKRRFYVDRVITIAWSRFNSHPHRTRYCVLE